MSDKESTTLVVLTYWKDLAGLQAFSSTKVHRVGWDAFNANKFPYMGLMHEVYHAPKGHWESIYHNMRPFGLSDMTYVPKGKDADSADVKSGMLLTPRPKGSTMMSRMQKVKGKGWDI